MTAKEFFMQIRQLEIAIESKKMLAETYRQLALGTSSPQYSDMPKSTTRKLEPMAEALMKAMEIEDEINQLECELACYKVKAVGIIQLLTSSEHQTVLLSRYFKKETWTEIREKMFYSSSGIYKLHGQALTEVDKLLKVEPSRVK